ncbi:MAG: mevalonate kinase, partial [Candidatus Aminicenantales bacterium]
KIDLPDINERDEFLLGQELSYRHERDYLRSTVNILLREGIVPERGWGCSITGSIPINSGTASSSALVVAWTKFLLEAAKDPLADNLQVLAELSFKAEVEEFKEPGGKMDHFSSSLGGIISLYFSPRLKINKFKTSLQEFVLADSLEKKDTTGLLSYIKNNVLQALASLRKKIKNFSLNSPLTLETSAEIAKLKEEKKRLLLGILLTRDLTTEAIRTFRAKDFDHQHFGNLLNRQHQILRDYLHISTPKIEEMTKTALQAGALGAKINGSGGGGCIFAYAPQKANKVAKALEKLGAKAYIVKMDQGVWRER